MKPVVSGEWFGCYKQGWGKSLRPESYAHPAKVSRGLARRIYQHMREEDWLKEGDTILDPFAGIGGFALDAMVMGCHFIGIELERPFVDMGSGCECTGVSKADWVQFYGRLDHVRYSGERYICPRCIAEAKGILPEATAQVALFAHAKESLSYRRNSGTIPETKAHHYVGNLEAWAKLGLPGTAVLLQGDSRQLLTWNFAGGKVEAICTSPPFTQTIGKGGETKGFHGYDKDESYNRCKRDYVVPSSPANLGNMKDTGFAAVVGSPPFAGAQSGGGIAKSGTFPHPNGTPKSGGLSKTGGYRSDLQGSSPGQLASLPEGDIAACLSSPPYAATMHGGQGVTREGFADPGRVGKNSQAFTMRGYGDSPANLGNLPPGSLEAVADCTVSSPPFEQTDAVNNTFAGRLEGKGRWAGGDNSAERMKGDYAKQGNLGSGDTFWSASRQILEQVFLCVKPGGHAVFVCGDFIRAGKRVEFSQQWATLCESVGFKLLHWHRAHKTERYGTQLNTAGGEEVDEVSRVSFFRRLQAKRGGETISSEEILCFLRP